MGYCYSCEKECGSISNEIGQCIDCGFQEEQMLFEHQERENKKQEDRFIKREIMWHQKNNTYEYHKNGSNMQNWRK